MPASKPCELQTLNRPASVSPSAFSSETIAPGSISSAPATPGTGGQYTLTPGGLLSLQSAGGQAALALSNQGVNNTQPSQNAPFNPLSLSSWETYASGIPSGILSTAEGLARPLEVVFNPGTPGGAPLAGGQFPNNYPYTQISVKVIGLVLLSLFGE